MQIYAGINTGYYTVTGISHHSLFRALMFETNIDQMKIYILKDLSQKDFESGSDWDTKTRG